MNVPDWRIVSVFLLLAVLGVGLECGYKIGHHAGARTGFYAGYERACIAADHQNADEAHDEVLAACMEAQPDQPEGEAE